MRFLIRWIVTAIALVVAVLIVPGIDIQSNAWITVAVMALILGLVNTLVRPILQFLSCGRSSLRSDCSFSSSTR